MIYFKLYYLLISAFAVKIHDVDSYSLLCEANVSLNKSISSKHWISISLNEDK